MLIFSNMLRKDPCKNVTWIKYFEKWPEPIVGEWHGSDTNAILNIMRRKAQILTTSKRNFQRTFVAAYSIEKTWLILGINKSYGFNKHKASLL